MRLRLPKLCRLRHKTLVDALFAGGDSLYAYPLRVVWRKLGAEALEASFRPGFVPEVAKVQMLVSVPKRRQRRAVDRVLMRRRIREAYRRLLPQFEARVAGKSDDGTISIAIVYISQQLEPFSLIERKLARLLDKLCDKL